MASNTLGEVKIIKTESKIVNINNLRTFCISALEKVGMGREDAEISTDVLITADLLGVHSHGIKNLRIYLKKIQVCGIDPKAIPIVISEGDYWAIMDGKAAMGMVVSCRAMEVAIAKAKKSGFGYVGVKNGSHFGAAGYYANMAARQNMIGIAMSNTDPNMSVPGGKGAIIGNNPFAYAVPTGTDKTILLDIAMSTVAALKVIGAQGNDNKIPDSWIVDRDGLPTTNVSVFPSKGGSLQPMAGHKGYGLALLIEILAAVLTKAGVTKESKSWCNDLSSHCNSGQVFIAINIETFMPINIFKDRVDRLVKEIHESPKAKNSDRIYLPGEIEWEKYNDAVKNGMKLPVFIIKSLRGISKDLGLSIKDLL